MFSSIVSFLLILRHYSFVFRPISVSVHVIRPHFSISQPINSPHSTTLNEPQFIPLSNKHSTNITLTLTRFLDSQQENPNNSTIPRTVSDHTPDHTANTTPTSHILSAAYRIIQHPCLIHWRGRDRDLRIFEPWIPIKYILRLTLFLLFHIIAIRARVHSVLALQALRVLQRFLFRLCSVSRFRTVLHICHQTRKMSRSRRCRCGNRGNSRGRVRRSRGGLRDRREKRRHGGRLHRLRHGIDHRLWNGL